MDKLSSSVGSNFINTNDTLARNKGERNKAITNTGESTHVTIGSPDVDQLKMFSPSLDNWHPVQVQTDKLAYNTIAYKDPQQNSNLYPALYGSNTPALMKKVGVDGATTNTLVAGVAPVTYDSSNIKMIQRRYKVYYGPDTSVDSIYFNWQIQVVPVPLDYELQPDERLDNGFYPKMHEMGNIFNTSYNRTEPFGYSFPTGPDGGMLYSLPIYDPDLPWDGTVREVPPPNEWAPTIDSVKIVTLYPFSPPDGDPQTISDPITSLTLDSGTTVLLQIEGINLDIPRYKSPEGVKTYFIEPTLPFYPAVASPFAGPYPLDTFAYGSEDIITPDDIANGHEWGTVSKPNIFNSFLRVIVNLPWDDKKTLANSVNAGPDDEVPFQNYDLMIIGIQGHIVRKENFFKVVPPGTTPPPAPGP